MTPNAKPRLLWLLTLTALIALLLGVAAVSASQPPDWAAKVDGRLLAEARTTSEVEFLVLFGPHADLSGAADLPTKEARGQFVYDTLRRAAEASQADVWRILVGQGIAYRPYWITNMLWVRGDSALIRQLAQRPEVVALRPNPAVRLEQLGPAADVRSQASANDDVLWNLAMTNAPAVWALGYEGQGIVVGGQDTGYAWTHPALMPHYRGWDGQTADHNYNWHDAIHEESPDSPAANPCGLDSPEPCDDNGHGTHTMGTMVGDDGQGTRTGMAPQAKWIGCRNMESNIGTPATYTECYEWFIAPYPIGGDPFTDGDPAKAPDVINNSWSCPTQEGCSADTLEDVVNAVRAAGIVTVHSAGNTGPGCETVAAPAALYDASFTVGALDSDKDIAGFSSRGPANGDLLKPDVVAPGVSIESTYPPDGYATLSGTSMAAPHVAGMVALLLSADPSLRGDVDAIEGRITATAAAIFSSQGCGNDTDDSVPNNVFGWGLIDTEAAVAWVAPESYTIFTPFGVLSAP